MARRRGEHGASLVEFALVVPLLAIFLFGIIDFGSLFANYESLRQGVQDSGRQAAVDALGSTTSCGLTFGGSTPTWAKELMCFTYSQVPQATSGANTTSVKLVVSGTGAGYVAGNSIEVCAAVPLKSLTGLFSGILNSDWMTTKASYYIEQPETTQTSNGSWTVGPYASWGWCS